MPADFKKKSIGPLKKAAFALGGVLLLCLFVFLIVADIKTYQKKRELNSQVENLKNKVAELQNSNSNLQQGISQSDDPKYIEKVAREELDLQKPGETVVSFVASEVQAPSSNPPPKSFWQNWFGWLGGIFKK